MPLSVYCMNRDLQHADCERQGAKCWEPTVGRRAPRRMVPCTCPRHGGEEALVGAKLNPSPSLEQGAEAEVAEEPSQLASHMGLNHQKKGVSNES